MKSYLLLGAAFFILIINTAAQNIALVGATAHIGNGTVIDKSIITIDSGKISKVLAYSKEVDLSHYKTIDVSNKQIYPGLIAPNTTMGLLEIELARPTRDNREVGNLNPNIHSVIAYNTDSKIIPTVLSNGVLLAQAVPEGGLVAGQSSIMKLSGWNWEDAAYTIDDGLHINWPNMIPAKNIDAKQANKAYLEQIDILQKLFNDAKAYKNENKTDAINLKLAALSRALSQQQRVFIHVHYIKEIIAAVQFIESNNLNGVLVDADDAYLCIDFLKEHKQIPIIITNLHSLPNRAEADLQQTYKTPAQLQKAGILYCLEESNWSGNQRNLPFIAGTAAAFGLSKEEALSSVSLNTAKILGIEKSTGSIEMGKDANLLIVAGDLLDMQSAVIEAIYIQGKYISPKNFQNDLYEKYKQKYSIK